MNTGEEKQAYPKLFYIQNYYETKWYDNDGSKYVKALISENSQPLLFCILAYLLDVSTSIILPASNQLSAELNSWGRDDQTTASVQEFDFFIKLN